MLLSLIFLREQVFVVGLYTSQHLHDLEKGRFCEEPLATSMQMRFVLRRMTLKVRSKF